MGARVFGHGELHLALLAMLADEPMHGYELMDRLRDRLGRRYRASPGSIYPALSALSDEGLLTSRMDGELRVYSLTAAGREALQARSRRLVALERRLRVSFGEQDVDRALHRFVARVRPSLSDRDADDVASLLDEAASGIEAKTRRS